MSSGNISDANFLLGKGKNPGKKNAATRHWIPLGDGETVFREMPFFFADQYKNPGKKNLEVFPGTGFLIETKSFFGQFSLYLRRTRAPLLELTF